MSTAAVVMDDPDRPGAARLVLAARVTVAEAGELHRAAVGLRAAGGDVTVDCAATEYLDAAALQVLLALGRDQAARGRRCDVVGVGGPLADVFRVAGLGDAPGGRG